MGRRGAQALDRNPNWKGGRSVASNGYVLVKAPGHHLADSRGYAYEHRIVAEQKIGRHLREGEQVHHIDHDKTNNAPENLEVVPSRAHHARLHRTSSRRLREPGERNPLIDCGCGCGTSFHQFDEQGRQRSFVSGHNPPPAPVTNAVLAALADGPLHRSELAVRLGKETRSVATVLSKLKRKGTVTNQGEGVWATNDDEAAA